MSNAPYGSSMPDAPADRTGDAPPDADAAAAFAPRPSRWSDLVLAFADRHRTLLFIGLLLVYVAGFNAQWRLEPDSALYLSIGRNLAEGDGYVYHGKSHRLAYPGLPVLFAGVYKVFPGDSLLPHLLLMAGLGVATLALVYRLVRLFADRPTAVLVTLGVGMSRLFYRYSFELLSDLPFLLGVTAFLVGYEAVFHRNARATNAPNATGPTPTARSGPRWYDWLLLAGGLVVAVAMRPAMVALVGAVVATAGWSLVRGGFRWRQLVVALAVVGVVVAFYLRDPRRANPGARSSGGGTGTVGAYEEAMLNPNWWRTTARAVFTDHLPELCESAITKAAFGMPLGTGVNTVLGLTIVALGVGLARWRPLWGVWVLMTFLMVLLVPKALDRYFLPVLPLLVLAWWMFLRRVNVSLPGRRGNVAFLALFAIGAVPNGAKVFGFIGEQQRRPFRASYKDGRYASADQVARMIREQVPPGSYDRWEDRTWVLVPPKFARILTLFSGRDCVEPDVYTEVDPDKQRVFVLEPSGPYEGEEVDETEVGGRRRLTVQQWLSTREPKPHFAAAPEALATVPNRDPDAKGKRWALHRVVFRAKDDAVTHAAQP